MFTFYHVAPHAAQKSIFENGLDFHLGPEHSKGNFVWGSLAEALNDSSLPRGYDIWQVDCRNLQLHTNECKWGGFMIKEPVSSDRLHLVRSGVVSFADSVDADKMWA